MMKKHPFLMALALLLVIGLACNDGTDPDPQPDPTEEDIATTDFAWTDAGLARVEDLDPRDFGAPDATHVNYAVAIVNSDLQEVVFGEKTFYQLDPNDPTDPLIAVIFNIYAPIAVAGGSAADNLLGNANQRTFELETFTTPGQIVGDYFFVEGTLSVLDKTNFDNARAFAFTGGTITVSGTAPNFVMSFDVTIRDNSRNIDGTFTGSISPTFRIIENR